MATSGIPSTGSVSIGTTAGATRSINTLMLLAANTPNTSLGQREENYMFGILTYGVCMPGQIQKTATWGPAGTPAGTYKYTAMNEFRGSYRWPNIVTGNPFTYSVTTVPYAQGNGIITCTGQGSPAYVNSSTPYFFKKDNGSWTVANANLGREIAFTGLQPGSYTIFIKDYEGCGSAENLSISVTVTYP